MSFLKKEWSGVKLYYFLLFLIVPTLAIIFGSFFDLKLSSAIVNPENPISITFEALGEWLGYSVGPLFGAMFFRALFLDKKNPILKVVGVLFAILGVFVAGYYFSGNVCGHSGYAWHVISPLVGKIISFSLMFLEFLLFLILIDKNADDKELLRNAIIVFVAFALELIIVNLILKKLAYRPRFRAMAYDNIYNGTVAVGLDKYQEWWQWNLFQKPDWFKAISSLENHSDYIKSYPSGHTATASLSLLFSLFVSSSKIKDKKKAIIIVLIVTSVYAYLVGFARVLAGAHFLSDVGFGALYSLCISLLAIFIVTRFFHDKNLNIK